MTASTSIVGRDRAAAHVSLTRDSDGFAVRLRVVQDGPLGAAPQGRITLDLEQARQLHQALGQALAAAVTGGPTAADRAIDMVE